MISARFILVAATFCTLLGCSNPGDGTLVYPTPVTLRFDASNSTSALLQSLGEAYLRDHSELGMNTRTGNTATLLNLLIDGQVEYFTTNHLPPNPALWAAPIAVDGLVFLVHPENSIYNLKIEQIRAIYQGFISNWRELGGPDEAILVYSREDGSGTRAEFERMVMGTRRTTPNALIVSTTEGAQHGVEQNRGAIAYAMYSETNTDMHLLHLGGSAPTLENITANKYPLRSTIYVVGLQEPQGLYRDLILWMQEPEAAALLLRAGFVPVLR